MKTLGGVLALLMAGSPAFAALPDASWSAQQIAIPGFPGLLRPPPQLPAFASLPPIPVAVFKGLSLKGVQFSRTDRIPAALAAAIDKTERTLRLAVYDLGLPGVADAITRAKARGVDVQLLYDEGHGKAPSAELQQVMAAGVPTRLLKGGGSFGIMHNKFAVFDGELLETGSFNWTASADSKNFENALFRSDPALAAAYAQYWDWMWAVAGGAALGAPPADASRPVAFNGGAYPRYAYSPQGGVEDLLVDALGRAKRTIDVAIFSLYSQRVADALIAAKARGVVVRVAADVSQSRRAQPVAALAAAGVDLRLSSGRDGTGVLHHKFVVLDGKLLMTGSYNFSQNAELYNFENDLFSTAPGEVAAYGGEFAAVWEQAHAPAAGELPAPKSL